MAFTQREDLFNERDVAEVMQTLADEGIWTPVSVSEPQVYLPGNADYCRQHQSHLLRLPQRIVVGRITLR